MAIRLPYSIGQSLKKGFSGETEKLIKKKKKWVCISPGGSNINAC